MSNLRNKVSLIGRVGIKPEKKEVGNGHVLTRFSIAINESYKDKSGEWKNITNWHYVQAWGVLAERICRTIDKGIEVAIEGKLVNKTYETKEGEKRSTVEIQLNDLIKVGDRKVS
jgi:single-strand DNA-binding protein